MPDPIRDTEAASAADPNSGSIRPARRRARKALAIKIVKGGYQGDFRRFASVGGRRQMLIPPGEKRATNNWDIAVKLYSAQVQRFESLLHGKHVAGVTHVSLSEFAADRTVKKFRVLPGEEPYSEKYQEIYQDCVRIMLDTKALGRVGSVSLVTSETVSELAEELARTRNHPVTGKPIGAAGIRSYLVVLHDVMEAARKAGHVATNPCEGHDAFPTVEVPEKQAFEMADCVRILNVARQMPGSASNRYAYYIIATLLYTGMRLKEVLGLRTQDIDFDNGIIWVRVNRWSKDARVALRRLKNRAARRTVPLWPHLADILREMFDRFKLEDQELLFDVGRIDRSTGAPRRLQSIQGTLRAVWAGASLSGPRDVRRFRHTWASIRVQMVERSPMGVLIPISLFTVQKEMGHSSLKEIESRYGHLQNGRLRLEQLDFRAIAEGLDLQLAA